MKVNWHVALTNRNVELDYLRCLTRQVLPILLPATCSSCKTFYLLNRELLAGWILLPLSDAAADPTVLNTLLFYLLSTGSKQDNGNKNVGNNTGESDVNTGEKKIVSPLHDQDQVDGNESSDDKLFREGEKGKQDGDKDETPGESLDTGSKLKINEEQIVEPDSKEKNTEDGSCVGTGNSCACVKFLETFVPKTSNMSDLWHPNLETILKDQSLLFAFMQFLKTQSDINVLQFCLDVEEFNSR